MPPRCSHRSNGSACDGGGIELFGAARRSRLFGVSRSQDDGFAFSLDFGTGAFANMRRYVDYDRLDAVVISHMHADHFLDLIPLRYAVRYGSKRRSEICCPSGCRRAAYRDAALDHEFVCQRRQPAIFSTRRLTMHEFDPERAAADGTRRTLRFAHDHALHHLVRDSLSSANRDEHHVLGRHRSRRSASSIWRAAPISSCVKRRSSHGEAGGTAAFAATRRRPRPRRWQPMPACGGSCSRTTRKKRVAHDLAESREVRSTPERSSSPTTTAS